jgi:hypothetical protein
LIADSTVRYYDNIQALRCSACKGVIEVPRTTLSNPESFIRLYELAQISHKDCKEYATPSLARNVRMFQREVGKLLNARAI